ncbi:Mlp2p KNAG_0L02140 [Huiozyma naganishii CBS 8797]|uniref:NUA/TPR/MLP1-2-like domain-containing protein n=1 Tax=Huiozyma naganishii (strain ATCC MYA-139 / BCRC 22969 / CBS 8797 / KCTC 17520 / NBRC 10181 / NCYC 3082 / Yp74L-3) TaxID=1071383 RepID=J7SB82_HUIN7|nr:hypothetical protein KNAG_0L02140 [Kazachstania naganishii CBS 8797]CCK72831.1 hypothetical protein KNAG_0L02140 [Kazachstania naganishii CBS 8797]
MAGTDNSSPDNPDQQVISPGADSTVTMNQVGDGVHSPLQGNELREKLRQAEDSNRLLRERNELLSRSLEEKTGILDTVQSSVSTANAELRSAREQVVELRQRLGESETQRFQSELQRDRLSEQLKQGERYINATNGRLLESTKKLLDFQRDDRQVGVIRGKLDQSLSEIKALRDSNSALLDSLERINRELTDKAALNKTLSDQLSSQRHDFERELATRDKLNAVLKKQVNSLHSELGNGGETPAHAEPNDQFAKQSSQHEEEISNYKEQVEELLGILGQGAPSIAHLRKLLLKERKENVSLKKQMESFVIELEHRLPGLQILEKQNKEVQQKLHAATNKMIEESKAKIRTQRELSSSRQKVDHLNQIFHKLRVQRSDLAHQIQFLLTVNSSDTVLPPSELSFIKTIIENENWDAYKDSQRIVSDRLLRFDNIPELQEQNMKLVSTVRSLVDKVESWEADNDSGLTLEAAKLQISKLEQSNAQLESEVKNWEALMETLKDGDSLDSKINVTMVEQQKKIEELESKLTDVGESHVQKINVLNKTIDRNQSTINMLNEQIKNTVKSDMNAKSELIACKRENLSLTQQISTKQNELDELNSKSAQKERDYQLKIAELSVAANKCKSWENSFHLLTEEKTQMEQKQRSLFDKIQQESKKLLQLETRNKELEVKISGKELHRKRSEETLSSKITFLSEENKSLHNDLAFKEEEVKQFIEKSEKQIKWYQQNIDELSEQNKNKSNKIIELNDKLRLLSEKSLSNKPYPVGTELKELQNELNGMKAALEVSESQATLYKDTLERNQNFYNNSTLSFQNTISELQSKNEALSKQHETLQNQITETENQSKGIQLEHQTIIDRLTSEKTALEEKLNSLSHSEEKIAEMKGEYDAQIQKIESNLKIQSDTRLNFESALTSKEKELTSYAVQIEQLNTEIAKLNSDIAALTEPAEARKTLIKERDSLGQELKLANQRIESLAAQNSILYDTFSGMRHVDADAEPNEDLRNLVINLRIERDMHQSQETTAQRDVKLLKKNLKEITEKLAITCPEIDEPTNTEKDDFSLTVTHEKIMRELEGLTNTKEENLYLDESIKSLNEDKRTLQEEVSRLRESEELAKKNSSAISEQEWQQKIETYQQESEKWKLMCQQMSENTATEIQNLQQQLETFKADIQLKTQENDDLNDRFTRLKKQAHEKLNASKATSDSLAIELSELKTVNDALQEKLNNQETNSVDSESNAALILQLKEENKQAKSLELELRHSVDSSEKLIADMTKELTTLKENPIQGSVNVEDYTHRLEQLKSEFEDEKRVLIEKTTSELTERFEREKKELMNNNANLEELRKPLEEEWERKTLQRIEEAKENLKKHIRLPTEEKIERVIAKRKAQLEEQFQTKVAEQANLLKLSELSNKTADELEKEVREEIKTRLEEDFELLKKKAFEEGRQQASMKTTLLERKIAKLEARLQGGTGPLKSANGLNKINIDSPLMVAGPLTNEPVLDEKPNAFAGATTTTISQPTSTTAKDSANAFSFNAQKVPAQPAFSSRAQPAFSFGSFNKTSFSDLSHKNSVGAASGTPFRFGFASNPPTPFQNTAENGTDAKRKSQTEASKEVEDNKRPKP